MDGRGGVARLLPRLAAGQGGMAVAGNGACVLGAALAGAGIVHLLAYHIPAGLPATPRWGAAFVALLLQCPLLGPLGLIVAVAVLAPLLLVREVIRLDHLNAALRRRLAAARVRESGGYAVAPRSLWRLAGFIAALLALQVALFTLAGTLCPMHMSMVMGGHATTMSATTALPLAPLHLAVAAAIGLFLWRIERCLTHLRHSVEQRLRLLAHLPGQRCPAPAVPHSARLPLGWFGHTLFARPPPLGA